MAAGKLRMPLWQQNFSILALFIFLLRILLKSASKSTFFCFDVEIRFCTCVRSSMAFCTSLFADRSRVAASRILLVAAPCVILLCFAAENCKSHRNGGVKVANAALAAFFLILALFIFLLIFFSKRASKSSVSLLCVKVSLCKSLLCVKACCV